VVQVLNPGEPLWSVDAPLHATLKDLPVRLDSDQLREVPDI